VNLATQLRALASLTRARLMLRHSDTTATLRRLASRGARGAAADPSQALSAVRRASRIVGGECLPQAVALTAMLQRAGHEPLLILGCRRTGNTGWSAHAWVRVNEMVLDPGMVTGFAPLASLSEKTEWVPSPVDARDYT